MTLGELNRLIISRLTPVLGAREASATSALLLEDNLGVGRTDLILKADRLLEPETEQRFSKFIDRIVAGEPPQYVVGKARFMGMDFVVGPEVLIPRPETAELVDIVVDYAAGRHGLSILDVGTGSGCIAVALSRAIPFAKLTAVDISEEALRIARLNADRLHARIVFEQADVLAGFDASSFDIVVSNPPYIAESEKTDIEGRVKDFEPHRALFVPDSDPLVFYRAIAQSAPRAALFFEINPRFAAELSDMLESMDFSCEIRLDSFGKKRFAIAIPRS